MSTNLFRVASMMTLLLACGAASSAQAQMNSYGLTITQTMQTMNLSNRLYMLRGRASGTAQRSGGTRGGATTARSSRGGTTKVAPVPSTTFRPVADSIVPQELARDMAKSPAERQSTEKFFKDLLESYKELARQRNAPLNDVARGASYLIGACYSVHHDGQRMAERDFVGLREQMHRAFVNNEAFQGKSDRERQKMYENFAITGAFLILSQHLMKENLIKEKDKAQVLADMRRMAREQFYDVLGINIEQARFTSYGVDHK